MGGGYRTNTEHIMPQPGPIYARIPGSLTSFAF